MIQSQPFGCVSAGHWDRFSVSAANPITRDGLFSVVLSAARISGFSVSWISGGPVPAFFVCFFPFCTCQSATAAAQIAISAGRLSRQAAYICLAVSTLTSFTLAGSGKLTGPLISVTRAPLLHRRRQGHGPVCLRTGWQYNGPDQSAHGLARM